MDAGRESGRLGVIGGLRMKWVRLAVVLGAAGALSVVPTNRVGASPIGTPVCGNLPPGPTVWSQVRSPYLICDAGVVVPSGATLTLDVSLGAVQDHAQD